MNKYLIVASDERSYLDLKNVVLELKNRNLPYFFLYNNLPNKLSPQSSLEYFKYDTNITPSGNIYPSQTLGFELPFYPTVLLITCENWEPEKSILLEFKQQGCFIGCVENSSWLHNNIKTKLELTSRKAFPSNCIDVFFDHSKWCLETKKEAGWWDQKSIITGNPRFDNFKLDSTTEDIIIVYGSMEIEHHSKILNIYNNLLKKYPKWGIFYKPHPNEFVDFKDDLNKISNLIKSNDEFFPIVKKSKHNIGIFQAVMYIPLMLNKNIVAFKHSSIGINNELDLENFKEGSHELSFWKRILPQHFTNFKEFKEFISMGFIDKTKIRNNKLEKKIKENLVFYDKEHTFMGTKSNNKTLLTYYDDFNDNNASRRIVNYIENKNEKN